MWKGTAEILNANPTKINTIPNDRPYPVSVIFWEIKLKFVEPENPYIKEQPYNNKPEDNALSIKYFTPDSEDNKLSRLKDAKTYKAKDWSSSPI